MSGMEDMIKKMESFLGTVGRPNEATRWYAARNGSYYASAAWCNMTITWAAYHSGNYDAVCFGKDYAYTVYHAQRFQAAGQWYVDTAGIRRGDIVFFDWGGTNHIANIDHIGIVTDVNGRDILTIEGNTDDRCARRVRHAAEIVGYGRPKYKDDTPQQTWEYTVVAGDTLSKIGERFKVDWEDIAELNGLRNPDAIEVGQKLRIPGRPPATPPPPAPTPPPPSPVPPADPYKDGLPQVNKTVPSAKPLQAELKRVGILDKNIPSNDNYGPATQASVSYFHKYRPQFGSPGVPWEKDIQIGRQGWDHLRTMAPLGGTNPPAPPSPPADDEPEHDYRRVTYGGKTVNVRTKIMLERAKKLLTAFDWTPRLTQGSYNKGVSASAGTHDGGGVVDINIDTMTKSGADTCVQALRKAGFAAWRRGDGDGMAPHIHAVAIGDKELSPAAKSQIVQWRNDTNGLANHGPDPAPDPYPAWTQKYR